MTRAPIYLHIGTMKSGTSYLQRALTANKDLLLTHGVLFPGRRWRAQVAAAEEAVGFSFKGEPTPGAWDSLASEINDNAEKAAVISMEFLSFGDSQAAAKVVSSFAGRRVRVIVTARDLARVIPSQWQQSVKNGAPRDFDTFLALISAPGARSKQGAGSFWGPQDLGRILRTWQPHVQTDDLVLVTVPPHGAATDALWQRFAAALELPSMDVELPESANESLGQTSVQLLLELNRLAKQQSLPHDVTRPLRRILIARAAQEPPIAVPEAYRGWVAKTADQLVADVQMVGPNVIGDLNELRVAEWQGQTGGRMRALRNRVPIGSGDPATEADVLDAALDAILGLSDRLASIKHKGGRQ